MLQFKPVVDQQWQYTDYHIYDSYGDYLGALIQYEWTGEWLYQTPLNKSVVMTFEEVVSVKDKIDSLMKINKVTVDPIEHLPLEVPLIVEDWLDSYGKNATLEVQQTEWTISYDREERVCN